MQATRFEMSSEIPTDVESLWRFHLQPEALEHLSPWWMGLKIVDPGEGVADDSLVRAEVGVWPLRISWEALHCSVAGNQSFTDIAIRSPFRYWVHQHGIEPVSSTHSRLTDVIWFVPPAWMPCFMARPAIKIALRALFNWRHYKTRKAVIQPENVDGGFQPQLVG